MKRSDYRPRAQHDVRVEAAGDKWALVFMRELRHPPAKVWSVLTAPAQLREWAPFDAVRDLGSLDGQSETTLSMAGRAGKADEAGGAGGMQLRAEVRRAEAPRVLEYTWGEDLLSWRLEPIASGTRLTLRHVVQDRSWISKVCAGWHICIDVAEQFLAGEPIGRIVGEEARDFGWQELNDTYATQLGVESGHG